MSGRIKLVAAVAVVLVALSGFSPAKSGKGRSKSGGGCSSSSSSSRSSSSSYDSGKDDYGKGYGDGYKHGSRRHTGTTSGTTSSNGSTSGNDSTAKGRVAKCAAERGLEPVSEVTVHNTNSRSRTYRVEVEFRDVTDARVDKGTATVRVAGNKRKTVDVRMDHPDRISEVADCRLVAIA